jgi:hypothetical protein
MADSTLAIKAFAIATAIAFVTSTILLIDINNRYLDLSGRYSTQSLELAKLQHANTRLEETLRDLNATLISTQKTPLVEASLNQLLTSDNHGNATGRWMWILDSGDVDDVVLLKSPIIWRKRLEIGQSLVAWLDLETIFGLFHCSITEKGPRNGTISYSSR